MPSCGYRAYRDQFLFPNDGWKTDFEFQQNCLAFALFHGQNRITSKEGTNHWIPFTEYEVNAQDKFASNFMTDFMKGKIASPNPSEGGEQPTLFQQTAPTPPSGAGGLYYYHPDHLGTSTALTDFNGNTYQFFLNLPFGETMAQQLGSNYYNSPYKFNGKELDEEHEAAGHQHRGMLQHRKEIGEN